MSDLVYTNFYFPAVDKYVRKIIVYGDFLEPPSSASEQYNYSQVPSSLKYIYREMAAMKVEGLPEWRPEDFDLMLLSVPSSQVPSSASVRVWHYDGVLQPDGQGIDGKSLFLITPKTVPLGDLMNLYSQSFMTEYISWKGVTYKLFLLQRTKPPAKLSHRCI